VTGSTARADEVGPAFSVARGGFTYSVLCRLGLADDVRRQVVAFIAIGWLMLVALAIVEALVGRPAALVRELSVHVRLLIGLPLLVVATSVLDDRCRYPLEELTRSQPAAIRDALGRIVERARRLRDSWWPELVLLATALVLSVVLWTGSGSSGFVGARAGASLDLSATHGWYALVALPLFMFVLARTLWLWLLWSWISWRISRLPLELVATHPDLAGGLGPLARPIVAMVVVSAANGAVVSSTWAATILEHRASLSAFGAPLLLLVAVHVVVALAPSVLFAPHLVRARLQGLAAYGAFAGRYVDAFHRHWIVNRAEDVLGTPDIQSLADLGHSFEVVEHMHVVPFGRRDASLVVLATLAPMLPLLLTVMPLHEVMITLVQALVG
jgi:hypothetical protein